MAHQTPALLQRLRVHSDPADPVHPDVPPQEQRPDGSRGKRQGNIPVLPAGFALHAARAGVKITNLSKTDPIVMLKHFGPENPDLVLEQP